MLANTFGLRGGASNPHLIPVPLPAIDSGTTTTLTVNEEWRRYIVAILDTLASERVYTGGEQDVIDAANEARRLMSDLYD